MTPIKYPKLFSWPAFDGLKDDCIRFEVILFACIIKEVVTANGAIHFSHSN